MSRDFTPLEQYYVSLEIDKDLTMLDNTTWCIGDKEISLLTPQESKYLHEYQYLGRANCDILCLLLKQEKLSHIEYMNNEIMKFVDNGKCDEIVEKWFKGKLDKGFYYREKNDSLLMKYLDSNIDLAKDNIEPEVDVDI